MRIARTLLGDRLLALPFAALFALCLLVQGALAAGVHRDTLPDGTVSLGHCEQSPGDSQEHPPALHIACCVAYVGHCVSSLFLGEDDAPTLTPGAVATTAGVWWPLGTPESVPLHLVLSPDPRGPPLSV